MSFESKQNTVADNVLRVLRRHPDAARDYRRLIIAYWDEVDGADIYCREEDIKKLTSPESITRVFRKLVEKELIRLGVVDKKIRTTLAQKYHDYYSPRKKTRLL